MSERRGRTTLSGEELRETCENELEQGDLHHLMWLYQRRHYHPEIKDFRISKKVTEGLHWIWEYQIGGNWGFISAKSEQAARDFVSDKRFLHEDDKYAYWR